ncbi:MAG TPA: hypothetical protein VMW22_09685 [Candidatus Desulfaltia sp.]|nr:hypothetical protein [Candidatus Desulfaltia sp.]
MVVDNLPEKKHVIDYERWTGGEMKYVGEAIGFTYGGKWYSLLYTRAGMYRGNHIHKVEQTSILMDGKAKYVFKDKGRNVEYPLTKGKPLHVPAGVPHILLPETDILTVEWWEGPFDAEEYDFPEYMDEVRERLEAAKKADR